MKYDIAPYGHTRGSFLYKGMDIKEHPALIRAKNIGMVFQDPENQIVMDNVMDELLFGLENIGYSTDEMRKKVAEMVHFFDINHLLAKQTHELSGGEKQLINLASVLLLDPDVLLLDEPTGQLDPIASKQFIHTIERLNDEFGITVVIVEHRLEELFSIADKMIVLEKGSVTHYDRAQQVAYQLANEAKLTAYLPSTSKLYLTYTKEIDANQIPLNVKEAKQWLDKQTVTKQENINQHAVEINDPILQLKDIDFQYDKHSSLILNDLSLSVAKGEWHAILGANGTGKSTLLKVISGILKPQHGHMKYSGKKQKTLETGIVGYLPQSPGLFFIQDTILKEYQAIAETFQIDNSKDMINNLLKRFELEPFQNRHPYDLSGGQLQKAALIGALLISPSILLIDEPTKGLDPDSKEQLGKILQSLMDDGLTIIMVTHDVEFAASYATRCSMIFQGQITVTERTRLFFQENMYYTTVMNRITRKMNVPQVVTLEEAKNIWHFQNNI